MQYNINKINIILLSRAKDSQTDLEKVDDKEVKVLSENPVCIYVCYNATVHLGFFPILSVTVSPESNLFVKD